VQINHIALKTQSLENLSSFYHEVLELSEIDRKYDDDKKLRSVWFDLSGSMLMIEKSKASPSDEEVCGWHLLALTIKPDERQTWLDKLSKNKITVESETDYSLYFRDPDGNRVCLSHYPNECLL